MVSENTAVKSRNYASELNGYLFGRQADPGSPPDSAYCGERRCERIQISDRVPLRLENLKEELSEIACKHESIIDNIIVQGSYGDFTENRYSDLDLILLTTGEALESPAGRSTLRRIARKSLMPLILKIDPLQHHGFFTVWRRLMDCYIDDLLPVVVYRKAWGTREQRYDFRVADIQPPPRRPLNLINTIIQELEHTGLTGNFYHIKRLSSHIMVLPAVWQGTMSSPVRKLDSFEMFLGHIPELTEALETAGKIRKHWPEVPNVVRVINRTGLGYRILGHRWPRQCGLLYRDHEIAALVRQLKVEDFILARAKLENELH